MTKRTIRVALIGAVVLTVSIPLIAQQGHAPATQPATSAAPATAPVDPNKVVLTVGDQKITAGEFNAFIADLPPQYQAMAQGSGKRLIADDLVKLKLMAATARSQNLENDPKVKRQLSLMQEQVLASALQEQLTKSVDEAAERKYYDDHKADYETLTARHILIRTPGSRVPLGEGKKELTDDQAKTKASDVRKRVAGGEDFAAVAKAESDDVGSGAEGGNLGTFGHGQMVKPFEDVAFALKDGEISQPVKTQFGYHVIQAQSRKAKGFEEARQEIQRKLVSEKLEKTVEDLKKTNKTEMDEAFFGPPAPPQPSVPGEPGLP